MMPSPTNADLPVSSSHEPPPLPALSPAPIGGEGGRRSGEGAFTLIAPIQVRILEVFTTHEPGRARHSVRAAVRHCQTASQRTDLAYPPAPFNGPIRRPPLQ